MTGHLRGMAGFTLLEVLIALVIAAVALAAAVRALGFSTDHAHSLLERGLAMQSAENHLAELRLAGAWPAPGEQSVPCPQGGLALICRQVVHPSQNRNFRQVTVTVAQKGGPVLARLSGLLTQQP